MQVHYYKCWPHVTRCRIAHKVKACIGIHSILQFKSYSKILYQIHESAHGALQKEEDDEEEEINQKAVPL